jgi:hypothetical protein
MKRTDIVLVSPAILVFVLTSTLSYMVGYPRGLDLTRYLTGISARFAIIMFMILIPRRKGDVSNPRGGVRHLISGKGTKLG